MGDRSHKIHRALLSIMGAALALAIGVVPAFASETHTVKRGDTLWAIALDHGITWPELFQLNRSVINDPDLIYPGQVLTLERKAKPKPDVETSREARPATGRVTSSYGMRTHPVTGVYKLHTGTDYSYGDGRAYAAKAGKVVSAAWVGGYGNLVTISHGDAVRTRYAHLARITVNVGERVDAGDVVGRIGSTGYATGPHLHFEVLRNGEFVNPASWL